MQGKFESFPLLYIIYHNKTFKGGKVMRTLTSLYLSLHKALPLFALALVLSALVLVPDLAMAGTGGADVQSWYTDISGALKGFWGKLIALAFIGFSLMAFKQGAIIPAIFLIFIGLGVGTIPDVVDARFTLTF